MSISVPLRCRVNVADWQPLGVQAFADVTKEYVDTDNDSAKTPSQRTDGRAVSLRSPSDADDNTFTVATSPTAYMHIIAPAGQRLQRIRCVCTAGKLELFTGPLSEYQRVVLAVEAPTQFPAAWQFDVPLTPAGVQQVALKMFPNINTEQRTFDIHELELQLVTVRGSGDATAQPLGASGIDMRNVQAMLNSISRPLSAPSERFRQLLASTTSASTLLAGDVAPIASPLETVAASVPSNAKAAAVVPAPAAAAPAADAPTNVGLMAGLMRQHLAAQLQAMEMRMADRMDAMERRIDAKLDGILARLQTEAKPLRNGNASMDAVDAVPLD